jgi:hypothetical protein
MLSAREKCARRCPLRRTWPSARRSGADESPDRLLDLLLRAEARESHTHAADEAQSVAIHPRDPSNVQCPLRPARWDALRRFDLGGVIEEETRRRAGLRLPRDGRPMIVGVSYNPAEDARGLD